MATQYAAKKHWGFVHKPPGHSQLLEAVVVVEEQPTGVSQDCATVDAIQAAVEDRTGLVCTWLIMTREEKRKKEREVERRLKGDKRSRVEATRI